MFNGGREGEKQNDETKKREDDNEKTKAKEREA